jgi:hypothetical protein
MRFIAVVAAAVLLASCGSGNQSSPVAPTIVTERLLVGPSAQPTPPPGPHFALEISPAASVTFEGEPWRGSVAVLPNISILNAEMPARVVTTCGAVRHTLPAMASGAPFSCLLPVGTHSIGAVAEMADGRRFPTAINATVVQAPVAVVRVYYDVPLSSRDWTDVVFGTQTFAGAEYRWAFGDGATATTLLNGTEHRYEHPGSESTKERTVTVQIVRLSDSRTLATGSVSGRW